MAVIKTILERTDIAPEDIVVLTFYDAQRKLLMHALQDKGVRIYNVDGFQGSESKLVLVSTVRANTDGSIGFVTDARRMNVAFARARNGIIVCWE